MADFIVSVNPHQGTVTCFPEPLEVRPDDTIRWGSFHGAVSIEFDAANSPLDHPSWSAPRGQLTSPSARVQAVKAASYQCTVTVETDLGPVTGHSIIVLPGSLR